MEDDFLRYSCQIKLPDFGDEGQKLLQQAKVLIVGAGGLGCPAAQYLAASGIGTLALADFDNVSIGNLHRQILFTPDEVGLNKAIVACKKLQQQNPSILLIALDKKIEADNVMDLIQPYDIVVDCTDNFDTRYLLNDACVLLKKPLVYGAIYQYEGQVAVWNVLQPDGAMSPNYRDVFPEVNAAQIPDCTQGGVIPVIAGMIGCMQANEVIKYITRSRSLLSGKLVIVHSKTVQTRIISLGKTTSTHITELPKGIPVALMEPEVLFDPGNTDKYTLVDVRTLEERMQINIGGEHIPIDQLSDNINALSWQKPLVFYCSSGKRSAEAVKMVRKIFPDAEAYSLKNGWQEWQHAASK